MTDNETIHVKAGVVQKMAATAQSTMAEPLRSPTLPRIADFYAGKNVFITGGTGFVGCALVEALLATSPKIGRIYILVRDKKGFSAQSRVDHILKKPLFKSHSAECLAKVVPVIGELTEVNFGIDPVTYAELIDKVNIVYHSAATIKFNTFLKFAINTNVVGTLRSIELAKALKNLSAYIYVSTSFCNSDKDGLIYEKVYPTQHDPYELIKLALSNVQLPDSDDPALKDYLMDHPNTYTMTKQVAENLIVREMSGMPAAIVRPSVVYGTYKYPIEGWIGNAASGHLGFLVGFQKGIFRTFFGTANTLLDAIPCDYVCNAALVTAWYAGTHKSDIPEVVHCTSGQDNPITWKTYADHLRASIRKHPGDKFLWRPDIKFRVGWRYTIFFYLFQMLPALLIFYPEKFLRLTSRGRSAVRYMQVFDRCWKYMGFFMDQTFAFDTKNAKRLMKELDADDLERYTFNTKSLNWRIFFERCMLGIRIFYFHESKRTTILHRIQWIFYQILYYLHFGLILYISYKLLVKSFGIEIASTAAVCFTSFWYWL